MARVETFKTQVANVRVVHVRVVLKNCWVSVKIAEYKNTGKEWETVGLSEPFYAYQVDSAIGLEDDSTDEQGNARSFTVVSNAVYRLTQCIGDSLMHEVSLFATPEEIDDYRERFNLFLAFGIASNKISECNTFDTLYNTCEVQA